MSVRLVDIAELCTSEKNAPGIGADIYLVPICGVETIPAVQVYDPDDLTPLDPAIAHTIDSNITLKTGYYFTKWTVRKTGGTYSAEIVGDEDAENVQVTVNAYLPKITNLKTWNMNQGVNGRFLVLVSDRNGSDPRIVGELGNGAKVKVTETTNDKNGYNLEITCLQDEFPFFYGGAITPLNP